MHDLKIVDNVIDVKQLFGLLDDKKTSVLLLTDHTCKIECQIFNKYSDFKNACTHSVKEGFTSQKICVVYPSRIFLMFNVRMKSVTFLHILIRDELNIK